ncbi:MAG: penicillin-binding protein activator LpoB [Candidatus Cyclonatronum sp.]|nr:penicillin-binding protein activator LpoB [Balneolales bacterium]MCH8486922.1 penicillin-binding protein activator LpoB [Cyclonatronum sp.]
MNQPAIFRAAVLFAFALFLTACGGGPSQTVTRVGADDTPDLSGRWNDRDARIVSETMISDVLRRPWLQRFKDATGRDPVVIVGRVQNDSMEHIDTEVFTKDLERELINSGEVRFVAGGNVRADIRDERQQQQQYASFETVKNLAQELGADFMLVGNINSIIDESVDRRQAVIFYSVNLELVNVETTEKVWIGNEQIRKVIERRSIR